MLRAPHNNRSARILLCTMLHVNISVVWLRGRCFRRAECGCSALEGAIEAFFEIIQRCMAFRWNELIGSHSWLVCRFELAYHCGMSHESDWPCAADILITQ